MSPITTPPPQGSGAERPPRQDAVAEPPKQLVEIDDAPIALSGSLLGTWTDLEEPEAPEAPDSAPPGGGAGTSPTARRPPDGEPGAEPVTRAAPVAELVMVHAPRSFQAEQYRSFRTNLAALNPRRASCTLLFASAHPSDGKSVSVANIALCLAESRGCEVCLIDGDVRVPSQHVLFGVDRGAGLTDVLLDRLPPDKALRRLDVGPTLMSAGRPTERAPRVMGSDYLPGLIGHLKQRFDYILFDTPPCIAFADAATLGKVVDGVVFVVAVGKTPRREVAVAMHRLRTGGATVIGSFVTGGLTLDGEAGLRAVGAEDERNYELPP